MSAADRRVPFEALARGAAFVLLALALWRAVVALREGREGPAPVHADLTGGVDAIARDSLAALAAAGTRVSWSGTVAPTAAMGEPVREPAAGWRISVAATAGSRLADELGTLDSLGAGGGVIRAAGVRGALTVREGATTAAVREPEGAELGRVLVYARAGWESKFAIAALEEQGWQVDTRLRLGSAIAVTQGNVGGPTLERHAAVVVLDSAVGRDAAAIARFVRAGGGLVMAGEGAASPSLQGIAPARVARLEQPENRAFEGDEPTHSLPLHVLASLKSDGVLMESRDRLPAVAARRVGAGRVVQAGYAETWRWRMQGEGRSVEEHRAFWSRMVGAVAAASYVEPERATAALPGDDRTDNSAPLAQTIQALGMPIAVGSAEVPSDRGPSLPVWLAPVLLALLVGEWASRRTRGVA